MKFEVTISLDSDALENDQEREVVRILRQLAELIVLTGRYEHVLIDLNGNTVGRSGTA